MNRKMITIFTVIAPIIWLLLMIFINSNKQQDTPKVEIATAKADKQRQSQKSLAEIKEEIQFIVQDSIEEEIQKEVEKEIEQPPNTSGSSK